MASSTTGEQLAGSPFELAVAPGPAHASRSVATLAVLVEGEACVPETPIPTLPAGAEVLVAVAAADEHGNALARLDAEAAVVEAQARHAPSLPPRW